MNRPTSILFLVVLVGCTSSTKSKAPASTEGQDPPVIESPESTTESTTKPTDTEPTTDPTGAPVVNGPSMEEVGITDEGLSSGYQDAWFDTWKRGRGNVVADWDGDGDFDVFTGNPGNESFLIRNVTAGPGEPLMFEAGQVLSTSELFYGGVAADIDNDGDPDLIVSAGANDGMEFDRLFRNDGDATNPLVDASDQAGLYPTKDGKPMANGTMGLRAVDIDNDGDLDLYASNELRNSKQAFEVTPEDVVGFNQLYLNNGDMTFEERARDLGLENQSSSRHASVFDFDNDGDLDIFDNAFHGDSAFYRNRLVEDGALSFEDITDEVTLDDTDLRGPSQDQSMCSLPVDLDNDGWQDLLILHRGIDKPYPDRVSIGHQVFMNLEGRGFVEVAEHTRINEAWFDRPNNVTGQGNMGWWGVMGCQVGDVDLDGFPDVFLGNGGGAAGEVNQLFVSDGRDVVTLPEHGEITVPLFANWTPLIDFEPPGPGPDGRDMPYPLRTHGTAFVDFDGDGVNELGVHNGGPAKKPYMEPNRLYRFTLPDPRFLRIELEGNGTTVNRDGIAARVRVRVHRDRDGAEWDLWKVRTAGDGFGAQNDPQLVFGLADADRVVEVEVHWPDGTVTTAEPPEGTKSWLTIEREG